MLYLILKFSISAAVVVAVSEIARRSSVFGALVASLPLTSLLAFVWLYRDTGDTAQIAALSGSIFWLVLPSLLLFVLLPVLLRAGLGFWLALLLSCVATAAAYGLMTLVLRRVGVVL
ncbi:DUF3147 family protein [Fontimonas sp. SYSU GA230001]|uniref:DUF3147 family protein n=1 Tax=Fontimonas sp. SYSU GA230001 TaxID=3142450 RepID=UPI0032B4B0DF